MGVGALVTGMADLAKSTPRACRFDLLLAVPLAQHIPVLKSSRARPESVEPRDAFIEWAVHMRAGLCTGQRSSYLLK